VPTGRTLPLKAALTAAYSRAFAAHLAGDRRHHLWGAAAVALSLAAVIRALVRRGLGKR